VPAVVNCRRIIERLLTANGGNYVICLCHCEIFYVRKAIFYFFGLNEKESWKERRRKTCAVLLDHEERIMERKRITIFFPFLFFSYFFLFFNFFSNLFNLENDYMNFIFFNLIITHVACYVSVDWVKIGRKKRLLLHRS